MVQLLWQGVLMTIVLTAVTSILSLLIGIGVGTMRLSGKGWRRVAVIYIAIHRNTPALVLIIFWAFSVPNIFSPETRQVIFFNNLIIDGLKQLTGLSLPYYAIAAILGLTLNTSAYLAELFRAGVGTIPQETVDAARTLGAAPIVVFWRILLPQGVRAAFPAINTRLIHNMKNTALASFVSVPEFFHATQTAVSKTFLAVQFLTVAAVVYLILSFLFATLLQEIDRRLGRF